MNKKLLSLALCVVMLASVLPLEAFAADLATTDPAPAAPVCTCDAACSAAAMNAACPVCSAPAASEAVCAKYVAPAPEAQPEAPAADPAPASAPAPTGDTDPAPTGDDEDTSPSDPAPAESVARAAALQARIDALPTVDACSAMDAQQQEAVYLTAQAVCDAYFDDLTEAEQALVNIAPLETLLTWFTEQVATLDGETYVAESSTNFDKYTSFQEALDAASVKNTIKLLDNINGSVAFSLVGTTTIDLNGHTLTGAFNTTQTGQLTIKDTIGKGTFYLTGGNQSDFSLNVTGGTVNISGGTIDTLNVSDGKVQLTGGTYKKVTANKPVDLLADGYAFFDSEDSTTPINANILLNGSSSYCYVKSGHTCSYDEKDTNNNPTGKCACGRECPHSDLDTNTGVCGTCGVQFNYTADGKPQKGSITADIVSSYNSLCLLNKAGVEVNKDLLSTKDAQTITIALNGCKFKNNSIQIGGGLGGYTFDPNASTSRTNVKLTGSGSLSNVTFQIGNGSLDLTGWTSASGGIGGITLPASDKIESGNESTLVYNIIKPPAGYVLKNGDALVAKDAQLSSLAGETLSIALCTHGDNPGGECAYCGKTVVAVIEQTGSDPEYITCNTGEDDFNKYKYDALSQAFNTVGEGSTVKLLVGINYASAYGLAYSINTTKPFTLDLNGHTLTTPVNVNGKVTITDSSKDKNGEIGELDIGNIAFSASGTVCTVNGGAFDSVTIAGGTLNITDGTFSVLNVTGGTVSLSGGEYTKVKISAVACIDLCAPGYAFYTKGAAGSEDTIINAAGKTLDGGESTTYLVKRSTDHTCSYDTAAPTGKCTACGRECPHTSLGDSSVCSTCGVTCHAEVTYTEDGSAKKEVFLTVQAAINKAAVTGGTIKLLANSEAENGLGFISGTGAYTLDLNGFSLKCASGNTFEINGNVTLKDSGSNTDNSLAGNINVNSNLTVNGAKVKGTVTVIGKNSSLIVTNGTFDGLDNNGKIELKDSSYAAISGGTFNVPLECKDGNEPKLSGGKFAKIEAKDIDTLKRILVKGYAYYDADDNPIALNTIAGTTLENVTVKECTHNVADDNNCTNCGKNFSIKVTYGTTTEYFTEGELADAFDAAGKDNRNGIVTLLSDVSRIDYDYSPDGTFTLDLNGHSATLRAFNVSGDVTLTDSGTGGMLNTNGINVTNKLTVNSGTIKGDVTVTGANSTLTVTGGTFDKSTDGNGTVKVTDGTVNISGGTFSDNITLQIENATAKLSGGKFGTIAVAGSNTLPGILKSGYAYKYYDSTTSVKWTDGADISAGSISKVEVKQPPIATVELTANELNPTYGDSDFTLTATPKDKDGKTITDDVTYKWSRKLGEDYLLMDIGVNGNNCTPYKHSHAGENKYQCEVTVDGYTMSAYITVTMQKATLTEEQITDITAPTVQSNLVYEPEIKNGSYTGNGISQTLFSGTGRINGIGARYEYSFDDGKTWLDANNAKRQDAGTYTALWRVNEQDYEIYEPENNQISATIAPRSIYVKSIGDISKTVKPYDGTPDLPEQTPTLTVAYKEYSDSDNSSKEKTVPLRPDDYDLKLQYAIIDGESYIPDSNVGTGKPILATVTLKNSNFVFVDDVASTAANKNISKPKVVTGTTGTITPAQLTITAKDKTAFVGDALPDLANPVLGTDYTVTGLAKGDTLESLGIDLELVYIDKDGDPVTPDMSKPGTYKINPEYQEVQLSNYQVNYLKGTLTISEKPECTITATAGLNGSISPSGAVKVKKGASQTFVITPNTGYVVANVKVDGVSQGSIRTYTFNNVTESHTIEATFMRPWGNPQTGVDVG